MLSIDGSFGEGGGQIVRCSLCLSLVTGTPFRITNIRAGRGRPGLRRQHLTAVEAAATIAQAELSGATLGSKDLVFRPGSVRPGSYSFAVGTAGSATLVLQTVLPALLNAANPSKLTLEGGTHNPMAPPFDFLEKAYLPLLSRMGPKLSARLERVGFYPAGGGKFHVELQPGAGPLSPLCLESRGELRRKCGRALIARLPSHIAQREIKTLARLMSWNPEELQVEVAESSPGPGNAVLIELESEHVTEVFTSFGQRGIRAEKVARNVADAALRYLEADVPVGKHLADQLLIPLALAGGGSFRTLQPSRHTQTQIEVLQRFLDVQVSVSQLDQHAWLVTVR